MIEVVFCEGEDGCEADTCERCGLSVKPDDHQVAWVEGEQFGQTVCDECAVDLEELGQIMAGIQNWGVAAEYGYLLFITEEDD